MQTKTATMQKARRGAGLNDLLPTVVAFVLIAIVGAIGALILQNFGTTIAVQYNTCFGANTVSPITGVCSGTLGFNVISPSYNGIVYGLSGVTTMVSYLPLIALVIVAAILIGIVLVAFAFGGNGGDRERF